MDGSKPLFASKSFWGALIAIAATAAGMFGYAVSPEDQAQAVDIVDQLFAEWDRLLTILGVILALYGRITATKAIR